MRVLGIESSCDDTACAIVVDGAHLIASQRLSSDLVQRRYGGVVPEVAAREHTMAMVPVVEATLEASGITLADIEAIAVTRGPGLLGALLVGVTFAKALGVTLQVPVVGVHHLEAHLYANALIEPLHFPSLALIVSGGHTSLCYWRGHGELEVLGATRDDAAGEALDKGARLLGLPYPGGPEIEQLADSVKDSGGLRLPVARVDDAPLDFSFSGVKTATDDLVRRFPDKRAEIARALQDAVVEALVKRLQLAYDLYPVNDIYLAGGVSANGALSMALHDFARQRRIAMHVPPRELCTDNAAMVAALGYYRLAEGQRLEAFDGPKTPWPLSSLAKGGLPC